MEGQYENITRREVNERTDIKTEGEVADYGKQGAAKGKKYKLVKPNDLLSLGN
jgi:hypothetical protein